MSKFTSGPWQVFSAGDITEVQDRLAQPVVFWSGFDRSEIPLAKHRANARLIAAAPELLDALRALLDIAREEFADPIPEFKQAEDAIAKATRG